MENPNQIKEKVRFRRVKEVVLECELDKYSEKCKRGLEELKIKHPDEQ